MSATVDVNPERIYKDLRELWSSLAREEKAAVLRACAMTLVVAVDSSADAVSVTNTVGELMHEHPSRAILLRVVEGSDVLESRVFAQCWMPFGRHQQICCEQIEISSSPDCLSHVPPVMLGITVPDLPVVLWCASQTFSSLPEFQQVLPLAQKVIVDTARIADPVEGVRSVWQYRSDRRRAADLAWTRVTRWREALAYVLDHPKLQGDRRIRSARIVHTGEQPPTSALYLRSWLAESLRIQPPVLEGGAAGPDPIDAVDFTADHSRVNLRHAEGSALQVDICGEVSRLVLPSLSDCNLLREELSVLDRDPVWERTLASTYRTLTQV